MDPITIALREYGTIEFQEGSNPQVEKYYKSCTDKQTTDDVPWCSAFVNWCAKKVGAERSKSLSARSWLNVGKEVKVPKFGDVIVMWRGSKNDGVTGHVAFYVSTNPDGTFNCLSGNQGDMVNISKYPPAKLLGFRRIY